jgi:hypothetical protein
MTGNMTIKLGKWKKVDLSEYWRHEAFDFTRWLFLLDKQGSTFIVPCPVKAEGIIT